MVIVLMPGLGDAQEITISFIVVNQPWANFQGDLSGESYGST
jgi:hypothetical protein